MVRRRTVEMTTFISKQKLLALVFVGVTGVMATAEGADKRSETIESDEFFENKSDGWHWYEDPPPDSEEEEEEFGQPAMASEGTPDEVEPMSAEWLRVMLPKLRDAAIDNPTDENISAYFYAQRIMFDKAQVFSDKARQVVTRDPLLDENLRLPFASAAKVALLSSATEKKREIVKGLADAMGLWLFYDETCVYCKNQILPINRLVEKHGLTVQVIHKQGGVINGLNSNIEVRPDTGQFENLGINFTPSVMMMVPPDGFYLISQGFSSYSELIDKLVGAANEYGMVSKEEFYAASPTSKGVLDASGIEEQVGVDWDNTEEWVPFIREEIAKTYGIGTTTANGE